MRRLLAPLVLSLLASTLAGCGTTATTATSSFSGTERVVAQAIANLQSAASSAEPSKICADDLSAHLVSRLGGQHGCESAIKHQLNQVDDLEVTVESVQLGRGKKTARAVVKSIYEGKNRSSTLSLVKESGGWKVAGLG